MREVEIIKRSPTNRVLELKINNQKFSYVTKKCSSLTDSELKHISRLFSENCRKAQHSLRQT